MGNKLGSRHIVGAIGEIIEGRFFVDKYLVSKDEVFIVIKESDRNAMMSCFLESIKEMRATFLAEGAFSPLRGVVYGNVFLTVK